MKKVTVIKGIDIGENDVCFLILGDSTTKEKINNLKKKLAVDDINIIEESDINCIEVEDLIYDDLLKLCNKELGSKLFLKGDEIKEVHESLPLSYMEQYKVLKNWTNKNTKGSLNFSRIFPTKEEFSIVDIEEISKDLVENYNDVCYQNIYYQITNDTEIVEIKTSKNVKMKPKTKICFTEFKELSIITSELEPIPIDFIRELYLECIQQMENKIDINDVETFIYEKLQKFLKNN